MRYADNDPRATEPVIPRCCACGATPHRDALAPVHLRLTARFPFLWVYRGRAPRAWWRSCLAVLRVDPTDPDAGVRYLCPACLPLARDVPPPAPCAPSDEPASVPPACAPMTAARATRRAEVADDLVRHILDLRQVFGQSAMINGATSEGHRGIEVARGSMVVRCRACGRDIARVADLAGATAEDEPMYEYTPTGLRACPATSTVSSATNGERRDEEPQPRTPLVLSHTRRSWRAPPCPCRVRA